VAQEKLDAISFLKFLDLAGKGRLGNMQEFCRLGKTAVGSHRMKGSQVRM
jgi:hypothetical protein